jgi:hypothetical protein
MNVNMVDISCCDNRIVSVQTIENRLIAPRDSNVKLPYSSHTTSSSNDAGVSRKLAHRPVPNVCQCDKRSETDNTRQNETGCGESGTGREAEGGNEAEYTKPLAP